ncbi:unnamed protein product [Durusdinium trenchii]
MPEMHGIGRSYASSIPPEVAGIHAAAAAAVEKPTRVGKGTSKTEGIGRSFSSALPWRAPPDLKNSIQKAQLEAERKRSVVNGRSADLESRIRYAQMTCSVEAMAANRHGSADFDFDAHRRSGPWLPSAQELMGSWVDMQGNSVMVYSVDAYEMRLAAAVSRPAARDLQLGLRPTPDGTGWICGNATLDSSASSLEELHWLGPRGRYSVWVRGRM